MTNDEYRELIEFLGERFQRVDTRFDGIEERLTRVEVFAEENRGLIQTVAERVSGLTDKLDDFRSETEDRFSEVTERLIEQRALIQTSYTGLDRRVSSLERRVDRLEEGADLS